MRTLVLAVVQNPTGSGASVTLYYKYHFRSRMSGSVEKYSECYAEERSISDCDDSSDVCKSSTCQIRRVRQLRGGKRGDGERLGWRDGASACHSAALRRSLAARSTACASSRSATTSDIYPQRLIHSPNGHVFSINSDKEYQLYRSQNFKNTGFGDGMDFVWASYGNYAVRGPDKIKVHKGNSIAKLCAKLKNNFGEPVIYVKK